MSRSIAMHIIASLLVIIVCPVDSYSGECENCGPVNGKYYCFYHYYGGIGCVPQNNGCSFTGEGCGIAYGCFLAGALVNTPNGVVPIEEIQVGDEVISMAENGDLQTSVVTETYIAINFDYYVINGSIQVTGTHPFKIGDGWVNAEEIEVGDVLSGINGEDIWVESVERTNRGVRSYNIEVDGTHTFFVDGILVHNKEGDPQG